MDFKVTPRDRSDKSKGKNGKKSDTPGSKNRHVWNKINLVTKKDRVGYYDEYMCDRCGMNLKQRGLKRTLPEFGCIGKTE